MTRNEDALLLGGVQRRVQGATRYERADDLWIVTSYYNPARWRTREQNYEIFVEKIAAAKMPILVVECAFGDQLFTLPSSEDVIQLRGGDVLWQKERLLNVALGRLPRECKKVVWLDCDVLFEREDWAIETSKLLETFPVLQPYGHIVRLPQGAVAYDGDTSALRYESFGAAIARDPRSPFEGYFQLHGHSGFAWAARRDLLDRFGFYDACLSGSGDHLMAHAFVGDWSSRCMKRMLGENARYRAHVESWGRRVHEEVQGRVGHVGGALLHLWHGDLESRNYDGRNVELAALGFDPASDLKIGPDGSWRWASDRVELHRWASEYFASRKEDPEPTDCPSPSA